MPETRSEYDEQVAVFQWAALYQSKYPDLFFLNGSIMGGTGLTPAILNKLKKAGMKKGKPDINLPIARGGYIGLWIELKRRGGPNPSQDQIIWLRALDHAGHLALCCKGSDAAISIIKQYVTGKLLKGTKPAEWAPKNG
jgi:hypothetical protein